MASPASEQASGQFSGGARDATEGLGRAIRVAKRAASSAANQESAQPAPVQWAELGLAGWRKHGALNMFRMK
eukprot:5002648-Pleurochrysis_carterae.AAC.1